jgi:hypothetical protein
VFRIPCRYESHPLNRTALCHHALHFSPCKIEMLLVGRLCGGVATSILYSVFECWAVQEHRRLRLPDEMLSRLFSDATTLNACMAIIGGLVAHYAVIYFGSPVAPFNVAVVPLLFCAGVSRNS